MIILRSLLGTTASILIYFKQHGVVEGTVGSVHDCDTWATDIQNSEEFRVEVYDRHMFP